MANQNGTAATILTSPGLFGCGIGTAGTGNSVGGYGFVMPDDVQFAYTCDGASPAVFTSAQAVTSQGALANGTPVSLGFTAGPFPYTATAANPAVFTSQALTEYSSTLNLLGQAIQVQGAGIPGGTSAITASTPQNTQGAFPPNNVATTTYYIKGPSTNTFNVASTLGGSNLSTAGGTAVNSLSALNTLTVASVAPSGFAVGVTYYMVSVSGNTFQLAATVGGSGINGGGTASAGIFQLQIITQGFNSGTSTPIQGALQVPIGASTTYQGIKIGGWRVGVQPGQVVSGSSNVSLDEDPQMAWQNVSGATCQTGNANTNTGATTAALTYPGWGMLGGVAVTGQAGQYVDEVVFHLDDNGVKETSEHRKVRLTNELNSLKEKGSRTAKENERLAVVEKALKELK